MVGGSEEICLKYLLTFTYT